MKKGTTFRELLFWSLLILSFFCGAIWMLGCGNESPTGPTGVVPPTTTIPIQQVFEFAYQGQVEPNMLLRYRVPVEKRIRVVGSTQIVDGNVSPTPDVMERKYNVDCGTRAFAELITLEGRVELLIRAEAPRNCKPPVVNVPPPPTPPTPPDPTNPTPPSNPTNPPPPNPTPPPPEPPPDPDPVDPEGDVSIGESHSYGNPTVTVDVKGSCNCRGSLNVSGSGISHTDDFNHGDSVKSFNWSISQPCLAQRQPVWVSLYVTCSGGPTMALHDQIELPNCQDLGIR